MEQHSVCLDSSERDEGRDGDFETKHLHQLLDRLREDLVGAEGDPKERRHDACSPEPPRRREQEGFHVIASDIRRPVQRRRHGLHQCVWVKFAISKRASCAATAANGRSYKPFRLLGCSTLHLRIQPAACSYKLAGQWLSNMEA